MSHIILGKRLKIASMGFETLSVKTWQWMACERELCFYVQCIMVIMYMCSSRNSILHVYSSVKYTWC